MELPIFSDDCLTEAVADGKAVLIPPGFKLYARHGERTGASVKQAVAVSTVLAFTLYCERMVVDPAAVAIYFDRKPEKAGLFALLDAPVNAYSPGRNHHSVSLTVSETPEMKRLSESLNKELTQGDLCELIEEMGIHFQNGAVLLDLVQFFEARESLKVTSKKPLSGYQGTVMAVESELDSGSTALKIPGDLTIEIAVFKGLAPVALPLKLGWKIRGGLPVFCLRCPGLAGYREHQLDAIEEKVAGWLDGLTSAAGDQPPRWAARPLFVAGTVSCSPAAQATEVIVAGLDLPEINQH
jgi:hypothetical protein